MRRRELLAAGLVLSPLVAALTACGKSEGWPEGMQPFKWDRDTCTRCRMVISDRRFAVQLKGPEERLVFKFDDIGCAVHWAKDHRQDQAWTGTDAARWWVVDTGRPGDTPHWLDARQAQYVTKTSPMAYNFAAVSHPQGGSVDFATMSEHVLSRTR